MEQEEWTICIGCITASRIFTVPEFGTRACFVLERSRQDPVDCCVAGEVARAFIAGYREGDIVAVSGTFEPRPSTASSKTPWAGRFRVRSLRSVEPTSHPSQMIVDGSELSADASKTSTHNPRSHKPQPPRREPCSMVCSSTLRTGAQMNRW
jgi:hypothetical protein